MPALESSSHTHTHTGLEKAWTLVVQTKEKVNLDSVEVFLSLELRKLGLMVLDMGTDNMAGCPGQDSDLPECDCDINRQEIHIHVLVAYFNIC